MQSQTKPTTNAGKRAAFFDTLKVNNEVRAAVKTCYDNRPGFEAAGDAIKTVMFGADVSLSDFVNYLKDLTPTEFEIINGEFVGEIPVQNEGQK